MIVSLPFLVVFSLSAGAPATGVDAVSVKVVNPLGSARARETMSLKFSELLKVAATLDPARTVVVDGVGKPVESQLVDSDGDEKPDELVFQSPFAAGESRTFVVRPGERRHPTRDDFKAYGRFVRERHDDFVWENDLVAHRMYGPDLENWKAEPLTSSGVDVWCKRVRRLVVNDWYMTDNYHQDNGEGADLYSVGKSRGCGGTGVWSAGKLHVSRNFIGSRVLANGPIRLMFELTYAPWDAGGRSVSETKRVVLDAGQHFNRFESTLKVDGAAAPLAMGIGIAKHKGGVVQVDARSGWMRSWEPLKKEGGNLGCAVVMGPKAIIETPATDLDQLVIANAKPGVPTVVYAGSAWDRGGAVADSAAWSKFVEGFSRELAAPLRVSMSAIKVAAPPAPAPVAAAATATPATTPTVIGADSQWSRRVCDSVMAERSTLTDKWAYDSGLILKGCIQLWMVTKEQKYFDYVKRSIDHLIDGDGVIKGYQIEEYNIDHVNMGKVLFPLLAAATDPKDKSRYKTAIFQLRQQMKNHPRTSDGAFWHKLIYPKQMWLDGVYMASPFLAEFAVTFNEPALFDDVANQVILAEKHMRDRKTGLLYHGWDESKDQRWANPKTGTSPEFWGRAMGWYAMAVVDVIEHMPKRHPKRNALLGVLGRLATAIASVQDKASGVWWQVLDAPGRGQNYQEASASAMFVYALAKGVQNGWLDAKKFSPVADRGYAGIIAKFIETGPGPQVNMKNICKVAGLGGKPYRDGSFDYYTHTEIVSNDPKGVGPFILASLVREAASSNTGSKTSSKTSSKTVQR